MAKLNFSVYGNCQAYAIARSLLSNPSFSALYQYVPFSPCFSSTVEYQKEFLNNNSKYIDLLIAQELRVGWHEGNSLWDVDFICNNILTTDAKLIKYSEIYSRICHPGMVYPKTILRFKNFDYIDLLSLILYSKNLLTSTNYFEILSDQNFLTNEDINYIFDLDIRALVGRELGRCASITSDVLNSCLNEELWFHTFNHPGGRFLKKFADRICIEIGLNVDGANQCLIIETLDTLRVPSFSSINNKYCFEESICLNKALTNAGWLDGDAYISLLCDNYAQIDNIDDEIQAQMKDELSNYLCEKIYKRLGF